jgi:hypothetical protein
MQDKDLFKSGVGGASSLVHIPSVEDIVGSAGLAMYDSVSVQLNETIQYFLTFDDVVKYIHFGKGLGSVQVEGTMFSDCKGTLPGLSKFQKAIGALRGKAVDLVIGTISMTAVMASVNMQLVGDPDTTAKFVFSFTVVNHQL